MKELDKNKAYDLRGLSNEQLREVSNWLKDNDYGWDNIEWLKEQPYIYYNFARKEWGGCNGISINLNLTKATTLFEHTNLEDLGFKPIGDGFYKLDLGNVEISVRNAVFLTDINDRQVVGLFEYDFEKVKKLVEVWK